MFAISAVWIGGEKDHEEKGGHRSHLVGQVVRPRILCCHLELHLFSYNLLSIYYEAVSRDMAVNKT